MLYKSILELDKYNFININLELLNLVTNKESNRYYINILKIHLLNDNKIEEVEKLYDELTKDPKDQMDVNLVIKIGDYFYNHNLFEKAEA